MLAVLRGPATVPSHSPPAAPPLAAPCPSHSRRFAPPGGVALGFQASRSHCPGLVCAVVRFVGQGLLRDGVPENQGRQSHRGDGW